MGLDRAIDPAAMQRDQPPVSLAQRVIAKRPLARADLDKSTITLAPFRASDFDLDNPVAKKSLEAATAAA